jgi:hypothetical protein
MRSNPRPVAAGKSIDDPGEEAHVHGTVLVSRRHVDLLRTASARCQLRELTSRR